MGLHTSHQHSKFYWQSNCYQPIPLPTSNSDKAQNTSTTQEEEPWQTNGAIFRNKGTFYHGTAHDLLYNLWDQDAPTWLVSRDVKKPSIVRKKTLRGEKGQDAGSLPGQCLKVLRPFTTHLRSWKMPGEKPRNKREDWYQREGQTQWILCMHTKKRRQNQNLFLKCPMTSTIHILLYGVVSLKKKRLQWAKGRLNWGKKTKI